MKIYRIYSQCMMGFDEDVKYKKNINSAIKYFNDLIRKTIKEVDIIDRDDFSNSVAELRENIENWNKDCKIICRKYPILIYKKENKTIATIDYWRKVSYEYNEYDIETEAIVLEEIELID